MEVLINRRFFLRFDGEKQGKLEFFKTTGGYKVVLTIEGQKWEFPFKLRAEAESFVKGVDLGMKVDQMLTKKFFLTEISKFK